MFLLNDRIVIGHGVLFLYNDLVKLLTTWLNEPLLAVNVGKYYIPHMGLAFKDFLFK